MPAGTTVSDVVNAILRAALAAEIKEVERYNLPPTDAESPPKRRRKKGGDE
jgi:hypothetical protein